MRPPNTIFVFCVTQYIRMLTDLRVSSQSVECATQGQMLDEQAARAREARLARQAAAQQQQQQ